MDAGLRVDTAGATLEMEHGGVAEIEIDAGWCVGTAGAILNMETRGHENRNICRLVRGHSRGNSENGNPGSRE